MTLDVEVDKHLSDKKVTIAIVDTDGTLGWLVSSAAEKYNVLYVTIDGQVGSKDTYDPLDRAISGYNADTVVISGGSHPDNYHAQVGYVNHFIGQGKPVILYLPDETDHTRMKQVLKATLGHLPDDVKDLCRVVQTIPLADYLQ